MQLHVSTHASAAVVPALLTTRRKSRMLSYLVAASLVVVGGSIQLNAVAHTAAKSVKRAVSNAPAADPVISPAPGTYNSAQTITIAESTVGAPIYYTTDGSYPSAASTLYTGPFVATSSLVVRAVAIVQDGPISNIPSSLIKIYPLLAATPVFPAPGGKYTTVQTATITEPTPGAAVYYTTDGSTPTANSTPYTGPITVATTGTIRAVAIAPSPGLTPVPSGVGSVYYYIVLPTAPPVASPAAGTYHNAQTVALSDATPSAAIYYTVDGGYPTTSSNLYTAPFQVSSTTNVRAFAVAPNDSPSGAIGSLYNISALTTPVPGLSPAPGTYTSVTNVSLSDSTAGAAIYYTTDGSTPTTNSSLYTGPISVGSTQTVRAVAQATGYNSSSVASGAYTINLPVATPVITPAGGSYSAQQSIVITDSTPGAVIYYTWDGTRPTTASAHYVGPIDARTSLTIRALAVLPGGAASIIPIAIYTIHPLPAATPVFSPAFGGKFTSVQLVSLSDATPGSTIYYTMDGSTPTANSTPYNGPITVSSTGTIRAVALAPANGLSQVPSGISSLYFYIVLPTADPVISPPAGSYNSVQTIAISDVSPGAIIYYTLDGSYPTTSSTQYNGPIQASNGTNIRVFADTPGNSVSNTLGAIYSVVAATPAMSPSSGSFVGSATVSLTSATPSATIYYTTDGTTPTVASKVYSGAISVTPDQSSTQIVQAIATAAGCANSAVSQAQFNVTLPSGVLATAQVGTTPTSVIPPNFLGLSQDWNNASKYLGQASTGYNSAYRTLVSNLTVNSSAPLVMRILGDDSTLANIQSIVQPLSELAQANNLQLTLGVDMWNNDPTIAQSEAMAYVNAIPANYISAIEIGNEPDNYWYLGARANNYAFPGYLADYQTWKQAVNAGTGGAVPIMGPSYGGAGWMKSTEAALSSASYDAHLMSQHYYIIGNSSPLPPDFLLQASSSTAGPAQYAGYAAASHQAGRTFRIGESNSVWGGGMPGISNSFSSALWSMDIMFEYLNRGIDGVNWHSSNWTSYELYEFRPSTYNGVTRFPLTSVGALYYGLLAFSQVAGNGAQMLPVSTATTANVKIWATVDSNSATHLVVINKDEGSSGDVQVTLPGYSTGTVRYLSAPSYTAIKGISLGGQTFDGSTDGTIQGQLTTTTINSVNGVFTLPAMPVTTAAIIDFLN